MVEIAKYGDEKVVYTVMVDNEVVEQIDVWVDDVEDLARDRIIETKNGILMVENGIITNEFESEKLEDEIDYIRWMNMRELENHHVLNARCGDVPIFDEEEKVVCVKEFDKSKNVIQSIFGGMVTKYKADEFKYSEDGKYLNLMDDNELVASYRADTVSRVWFDDAMVKSEKEDEEENDDE